MAVVGTAFVRLRVIGDKLKGDIASATKKAVNDAAPDLDNAGEGAGKHVAKGMTDAVDRDGRSGLGHVADDIGNAIGDAMGKSMGRSLRRRMSTSVRDSITRIKGDVDASRARSEPAFEKMGKIFGKKSGKGFAGVFKDMMVSGIGLAVVAAPSVLAFLGAAIGAVAGTAVTALTTIGPAAVGAALTAVSAFAAIKISTGLIGLALKQQTPQLLDFQDRMDKFKTSIATPIQAGMLSGFNASMRMLQPVVTALQPQLRGLGTTVGDLAMAFADSVRQGANLERIQRILSVNNDFIRLAGSGVSSLALAFLVLLDHLSPITEFLGAMVRDIGQWVLQTILAAEVSGQLDAFITQMFNALRQFVGILVDFGVGIWNVFSAAHAASGGMLTTLQQNAAAFRDWTGDPANRERMIGFFERARVITGQLLSVLKDLAGAAGRGLESTNVEKFTHAMDLLRSGGEAVGRVFEQIRANAGDKLQTLFTNFTNLLVDLSNSGVIGTVASALSNLFAIISMILQIPGISQLLAFGAGLLVIFKTLSLLWTVLGPILEILWLVVEVVGGALVAAFGWIPVVIGLVIAALVWFFTQTEIGRAIIAAVWNWIKNAIGTAVDGIVAAWNWMVGIFQSVWQWISNIAQSIWQAISTAFNAVVDAVSTAINAVWNVITTVWNAIWGFIQPIIQGIWDFIQMVFNGIRTVIETILNIIYEIWIRVWPLLALPIRILYGIILVIWNAIYAFFSAVIGAIVDFVVVAWNGMVSGITTALQAVWDFIQYIWNAVWGFIQPILQSIGNFFSSVWNGIVSAVSGALSWIWNIITTVWNAVYGFINGILDTIAGYVRGAWDTVYGAVSGALNKIWGVVKSVWNNVMDFIRGAMDTIGDIIGEVWDFLGGVGDAVLDGIKSAVNVVIDAINWVIKGINWAIDLANKLPGGDIPHIPAIPRLAKGGVVSPDGGGMLAMIAEAGRAERVEPLDAQGLSARDRAIIAQLAGNAGGGGGNTVIYIGTRELTELVDFVVEDREDRLAARVTTGSKVA